MDVQYNIRKILWTSSEGLSDTIYGNIIYGTSSSRQELLVAEIEYNPDKYNEELRYVAKFYVGKKAFQCQCSVLSHGKEFCERKLKEIFEPEVCIY